MIHISDQSSHMKKKKKERKKQIWERENSRLQKTIKIQVVIIRLKTVPKMYVSPPNGHFVTRGQVGLQSIKIQ